jgi:hypothetical protein
VRAIGLQTGLTYLPWEARVNFRWQHEYYAEARLIADWFLINLSNAF